MIGWALAIALAAPPDRAPATFALGTGAVGGLVVSGDGRLVAAVAGSAVHLLDTDDWSVRTSSPCTVTSVDLEYYAIDTHYLWVGCSDGDARLLLWEAGDFGPVEVDDEPLTYDLGDASIEGVWSWDQGATIYVLSETTEGNLLRLHTIDADSGEIDAGSAFPIQMPFDGYVDGVETGARLIVFHGGSEASRLTWGGSAVLPNLQNYPYSVADASTSIRDSAYVAADTLVAEYVPSSFVYSIIATGLDDARAVAASIAVDDEWLAVSSAAGISVYGLASGTPTDDVPLHTFDPGTTVSDMAVARWGYGFGAGAGGALVVLTANPWVSDVVMSPTAPGRGESATLFFTVDRAVEYEVFLGGDASATGTSLATGSIEANATGSVVLTIDDRFVEGENPLYVLVKDSDDRVGHGTARVTLDDPPPAPDLDVTAANEALVVRLGTDVDDVATWAIYVATAPFDPATYPTGGPAFDGPDAIATPVVAEAAEEGDTTVRIEPLRNDVTYYIAARATDRAGQEGAMSVVVEGVPRPTQTATDLAGEEGGGPGCGCATGTGRGALVAALAALGLVARRRRSWLALGLVAALLPRAAAAQSQTGDATPAWANFEIRYGTLRYVEPSAIVDVYGKTGHDQFTFEMGGQFLRYLEADFGISLYRDSTFTRDDEGTLSDEGTALRLFPLYFDVTGRVHIWDEQILVPFARIGVDYVLWREVVGTSGGEREGIGGGKAGWHWGVGGQVLLDVFAPGRASLLEASTGINDSWLTIEWRRQRIDPGRFLFLENSEGLSFSGDVLQVGIKIDY